MTTGGSELIPVDGLAVHVRFLGPADVQELEKAFSCLSRKTIFYRFLDPIRRLTPSQLRYLTNIDNRSHLALCAHSLEHGVERGLGIARYVSVESEPGIAEVSLLVMDEYQNRGIGQLLFHRLLTHAARNGVRVLRGYVKDDNYPMLTILRKSGARFSRQIGGICVAEVLVPSPPAKAL